MNLPDAKREYEATAGDDRGSSPPRDTIRLDVRPAHKSVGGHEVVISVNGDEMTAIGSSMGMDPFDILIPVNRLAAGPEPRRIPVARCNCGIYDCGPTDALIVRDGLSVHWEWKTGSPRSRSFAFAASQYGAELARVEADRSWERRQDTVARLVLHAVDAEALAELGIKVLWAAPEHFRRSRFLVFMQTIPEQPSDPVYQVFFRVRWRWHRTETVARNVTRVLSRPPREWPVTYQCAKRGITAPPPMAGPRWRPEQ